MSKHTAQKLALLVLSIVLIVWTMCLVTIFWQHENLAFQRAQDHFIEHNLASKTDSNNAVRSYETSKISNQSLIENTNLEVQKQQLVELRMHNILRNSK